MRLQIHSSPFSLSPGLQARICRRLDFALSRIQRGITGVTVRLRDLNGPRGGVDKQCAIEAHLRRGRICLVEDTDTDLYAAIDRAAGRLGRLVAHRQFRRFDVRQHGPSVRTWMFKFQSTR